MKIIPAITLPKVSQQANLPNSNPSKNIPGPSMTDSILATQVINSLQAIHSSNVAALLDSRSPVSNRQLEWKLLLHDLIIARGREYVSRLHGDEQVIDKMDQSGTTDLDLAVRICYGFVLSDVTILDAVETGLIFMTALIVRDVCISLSVCPCSCAMIPHRCLEV